MRLTRNRKWLVGILVTVVGLAISSITVLTYRPSVDYYFLYPSSSQFKDNSNSVTIYCKYGSGKLDAHFSLIVKFINASFSDRTRKPYTIIDDSTVKFSFLLHEGENNQKIVWFTIHDNIKGFRIELTLEQTNVFDIPMKPNPMYPTRLQYDLDGEHHFFILEE